jgi:hypothetical protein
MTKKHYKAAKVIDHLANGDGIYAGFNVRLVSPRKSKQETFFEAVDRAESVFQGVHICGRKETLCESLQKWRDRKGCQEVRIEMEHEDCDVPF